MCEYPSSKLEVAEVQRIRADLPVGVLTIVLQLLLHCEFSAVIIAFAAKRVIDVELTSEPSNSENCPTIMLNHMHMSDLLMIAKKPCLLDRSINVIGPIYSRLVETKLLLYSGIFF